MEYDSNTQKTKKNIFRKPVRKIFNVGDVFQPIRVRHRTIFSYFIDREFNERKFGFILFIGFLFWTIFLLSKIG